MDPITRVSGLGGSTTFRRSNYEPPPAVIQIIFVPMTEQVRVAPSAAAIAEEFDALANEWHAATDHLSVISDKVMHPAYQDMLGMGELAIPHIVRHLRKDRGWWFHALQHIARGDAAADAASKDDAIKAWTNWAREQGYISSVR